MLADDVGVDAGGRDPRALGELPPQPRRVEHRARGEDALRREAGCLLCEHRQHVAGVGDDDNTAAFFIGSCGV